MKIKIRCKKCGWEAKVEVQISPLGTLQPDDKVKGGGLKVDWTQDQIDKILEAAGSGLGASKEDLESLGIRIPIPEWKDAIERKKLRDFVKKHLRVSKDLKRTGGEKSQVSTAPWQMGDSFKDVDLTTSEVKSMGVEDLRLIPGVTLQKRVYETSKGQDREVLKGIKFFNIIDVSGSMFGSRGIGKLNKIDKALMMSEESYKLCKKLGYNYNLAIFSSSARRIPQKRIKRFFESESERASYPGWNGGTTLSSALNLYKLEELKDANLVIMSDMDISDIDYTKKKLKEIGTVTNSFKVVLIEDHTILNDPRVEHTKLLFPDKKVEILPIAC